MEKKPLISFLIVTYNSDFMKLCYTIDSIIGQKNIDFEIVISDDGSKKFEKEKIIEYINSKNFNNFKILDNLENKGTVLNIYNALKHVNGKYVKLFSPGDFLYNDSVISKALNYMIENNYDIIFGKAAYYYHKDSKCHILNKTNPLNLEVYRKKKYKKIKKNYLYYNDFILGAALVSETKLLEKYIGKIANTVIYAEDTSYAIMIADNIHIEFWDEYMLWYECDVGISNKSEFNNKIALDIQNCYRIIGKEHKELSNLCKMNLGKSVSIPIWLNINRKYRNIKYRIRNIKYRIRNRLFRKKILKEINLDYLNSILCEKIYM